MEQFLRKAPTIGKGVFVAPGAVVLGDVSLGEHSSVWFNAVLRGDINSIVVGHHTNVQDNAVLHLADDYVCVVGNYVTIGHSAIIHACTVGDEVLVGMGSTILGRSNIEGSVISCFEPSSKEGGIIGIFLIHSSNGSNCWAIRPSWGVVGGVGAG